jgi:hypothetical protein
MRLNQAMDRRLAAIEGKLTPPKTRTVTVWRDAVDVRELALSVPQPIGGQNALSLFGPHPPHQASDDQ